MKKILRGPAKYPLIVSVVLIALFGLGWWLLRNAYLPVLQPSGVIASSEQKLILFTVILSAVVVIPVFIMLAMFAWKYREGNQKATYKPEWANNNRLEAIWWGIPIAIIGVLSIVTWVTSHSLDPYRAIDAKKPAIQIQVVALQWKWLFIYPDQHVASVNELVVPVNTPVEFKLTADAPMSAFWVPALGSQIYSMNGMDTTVHLMATKQGTYTGYNTNINGKGYADMTFTVKATDQNGFNSWVKQAGTNEPLSLQKYQSLIAPSTMGVTLYRVDDDALYEEILAKYMNMGSM